MRQVVETSPGLRAALLGLPLWFWLGVAAGAPTGSSEPVFGRDSHEAFVERVNAAQGTDYQAVLALYDARRASLPDDVVSQIERCRFIEKFAYSDDVTIESSNDDLEACRAALTTGPHKDDVEVILYDLSSGWDAKKTAKAKALIPQSAHWNKAQQTELYELLAGRTQWKDAELSASYAMKAIELDPGSSVLLIAVKRWVQLGAKDKARRVIFAAPERTWEKVSRAQVAQVLLDIGEAELAKQLITSVPPDKREAGADLVLARALASKGEFKQAGQWYRDAVGDGKFVDFDTRVEYFEFSRDHGTRQEAVAAYENLRGQGFSADALGHYRLSLLLAHPSVAWHWRDTGAVLTLLAAILLTCLFPLLAIVPVHYRGLALRASGRAPDNFTPAWSLRHAWYAFAVFLVTGFATVYLFAMPYLNAMMPGTQRVVVTPLTDQVLARILLWSIIATFLLLLPLLRGRSVKALLCGTWSIRKSILAGIGCAILLKMLAAMFGWGFKGAGVLGSDTVRAIQGANEFYGLFGMLMLVAVLTPITEELVFRGVLLQAFRGQVSFLFATLVQSVTFVLMHEEWQSMGFLLVFALVAGWLAKRSGGLLASMVLHCVNNATAGLAIIGMTSAPESVRQICGNKLFTAAC